MPCNHQEADSRICMHLFHATRQRHSKAFICIVDSDIMCIAVGHFGSLGVIELRICFGTGKTFQHIPFMKSSKYLVLRSRYRFHCSILSSCVTQRHLSLASGRKLPGQHGRHTHILLKHNLFSGCPRVNDARRQFFTHVLGRSITPATTYSNMQDEL